MKLRSSTRLLAAAVLAGVAPLLALAADSPALAPSVARVGYTVADLDRSVAFFTEVLEFEALPSVERAGAGWEQLTGVFAQRTRSARLRLGSEELELTEYLAPRGRPLPAEARSNDLAFQHVAIVVSDMAAAWRRLRQHRVAQISPEPQRLPDWNPDAGGIEAFYFRDPDGHALELIAFPPGKGEARWQDEATGLFLGIDHTAIAVSDTERSLAFYRDALGLRVAGASENYGPEQERLNGVFGARLRITGLRGGGGPGIELLEYLSPRDGRPAPEDLRANDLAFWQTTLRTTAPGPLALRLRGAGARWVSPGVVTLDDGEADFGQAALLRDPDGHPLRLVDR